MLKTSALKRSLLMSCYLHFNEAHWPYMALSGSSSFTLQLLSALACLSHREILAFRQVCLHFHWGSRWGQIVFTDYVLRWSKRATLKNKPKIKVNFSGSIANISQQILQLLAIWKHGFVRHCQIFHNDLERNKWIILWYIGQNLSDMVSCWGARLESKFGKQRIILSEFFFSSTQAVVLQMELWSTWNEDKLVSNQWPFGLYWGTRLETFQFCYIFMMLFI